MARVKYVCADHGTVTDIDECDSRLHTGHCPECDAPVGVEIA